MQFTPDFTVAVEVLSPTLETSDYSNRPTLSWSNPTVTHYSGVVIYAGTAVEDPGAATPYLAIDKLTAIFPYGSPVKRTDRVRVLAGPYAGTYDVDGRPAHWRTPWSGWEAGTEVRLTEVAGG